MKPGAADGTLYYGDNLDILLRYIANESVDLIYLDPPFKSNQCGHQRLHRCRSCRKTRLDGHDRAGWNSKRQ